MTTTPARPRPGDSLVASARRLTNRRVNRKTATAEDWQNDAWDMYDLVGEHRFLTSTLAGRLAQARLYIGKLPTDPAEDPEPVTEDRYASILEAIGGSAAGRAQILYRLAINLSVPGESWLAAIPSRLMPSGLSAPDTLSTETRLDVVPPEPESPLDSIDVADLEWRALSRDEVITSSTGDELTLILGEDATDRVTVPADDVFLIRVWRPHPRKAWQADSPTRASLPVLRELVGLTMHVSAQVDSRLAGAGLLIVPMSAVAAFKRAAGYDENDDADPLTDALIEAMTTPITDRSSASAIVPLILTVPDDAVNAVKHIDFAQPLDTEARNLRDEAIRRLGLGMDAPPELLLGTAGMNHWGAWLMQEDVVTTHLEPPLALICDALTVEYLWPVLMDQGLSEEEARQYVIWYDVSDLVVRPNRSDDAFRLHDAGAIDDEALRDATGFDESAAPEKIDPAVRTALDMVTQAPSLLQTMSLLDLVAQIRAAMNGDSIPAADPAVPAPADTPPADGGTGGPPDGSIPQTDGQPPEVPPAGNPAAVAASGLSSSALALRIADEYEEEQRRRRESEPLEDALVRGDLP